MMNGKTGMESHVARVEIEYPIIERARGGGRFIQIIEGPRGAGKTTLLRRLAARLTATGVVAPLVDLDWICTGPMQFAKAFVTQVESTLDPVSGTASAAGIARLKLQIDKETQKRRPDAVALIELALSAPSVVAAETGLPTILLLDEAAEVVRLTRHAGLRDGMRLICGVLGAGEFSLIATVSPASRPAPFLGLLAGQAGEPIDRLTLPSLSARELAHAVAALGCAPPGDDLLILWMNATNGHPLYVAALSARVAQGEDLATAMMTALTPPLGALHQECRYDYQLLVERSRGQAVVRAILDLLAREAGANLTRVAGHLRIALPTALDYLSWLLEVGLARRDGGGYVITDPMLSLWIRLNGPEPGDPLDSVVRFLERPRMPPRPAARPRGRRPGAARSSRRTAPTSSEFRIEID